MTRATGRREQQFLHRSVLPLTSLSWAPLQGATEHHPSYQGRDRQVWDIIGILPVEVMFPGYNRHQAGECPGVETGDGERDGTPDVVGEIGKERQEEAAISSSRGKREHFPEQLSGLLRLLVDVMRQAHKHPDLQCAACTSRRNGCSLPAFEHAQDLFHFTLREEPPGNEQLFLLL